MSILSVVSRSTGPMTKDDLVSFIKRSNYYSEKNSSGYERNYYLLIKRLHIFKDEPVDTLFNNNGLWKLKLHNQINYDDFCSLFQNAWGNRNNKFSNHITHNVMRNTYQFITNNDQVTLLNHDAIYYIEQFIADVFHNINPWETLVYFSKYLSTFLPDLCIPVDTSSLRHISVDYDVKVDKNKNKAIKSFVNIHKKIKISLEEVVTSTFDSNVMLFKQLDDYSLVSSTRHCDPDKIPINRPIDKMYYSV